MKKFKLGLMTKLILGILIGILIGSFAPKVVVEVLVTFSSLFASFLKFTIPFIIIGFIVVGIADLARGAGKLLFITTGIAYFSTIIAGIIAYLVAKNLFPLFISGEVKNISDPSSTMLEPLFSVPIAPLMDVTTAIVFAFMIGLGLSALTNRDRGVELYNLACDFQDIIKMVLSNIIIPILPFYIAGTFANITFTGEVFNIINIFWKVFLVIIPLHIIYISFMFIVAGVVSKKNPFTMIKNQSLGYITALGTQSSAATIPINIQCAEKNGVSKKIREFVVPLCATIHLSGSVISLMSFSTAVLMMNSMDYSFNIMLPFLMVLGIAMVAAPGAPGGAIMSALPFLPMIGIPSDGGIASIMIALYITQDSFGTAANVSGDNAIAVVIDKISTKIK
ncbi:MAG: dicarboxylate/amino acid:cation symporter [Clostridium sp.]